MKSLILFITGVFSFIYILVGLAFITGKLNFDFDPTVRLALGSVIFAYGIFRVYMFYRKIRSERSDENN